VALTSKRSTELALARPLRDRELQISGEKLRRFGCSLLLLRQFDAVLLFRVPVFLTAKVSGPLPIAEIADGSQRLSAADFKPFVMINNPSLGERQGLAVWKRPSRHQEL
jgi:hypothetical protein